MTLTIQGIVPVIPTPFTDQEAIDVPTLHAAVNFAASRKMAAMCLPAYGSEFYKLSEGERELVVTTAIETCRGRIPVIAQANHPSAKIAAEVAQRYEQIGADVISFALPRQFGATEDDLLNYCGRLAGAVSCPVLVQDFNPGGPTVSAEFISIACQRHANIAYFKIEEPMILDKLVKVRESVGDRVHVLGGWGGYFMLESIAGGVSGFMPGLALCDLHDRVYRSTQAGNRQRAYDLFSTLLPFIAFSLQDFEMFLQLEKRLLMRRGIFVNANCRALTRSISPAVSRHADFLIEQMIRILDTEGLNTSNS
ncbi:MAG: dihydrodipicolinate synthase family protein [Planctomycetes bacterium]|nr:dihydrodipicolinate synthase family protein [Planctomycetota bacterium]